MIVNSILQAKGSNVFAVNPDTTAMEVAHIFTREKIGFAVVSDEKDGLIGTITERDIIHSMSENGANIFTRPIRNFMTEKIISCRPDDRLPKVMSLMTIERTRHVLVLDDGEIKGVISIGDVVKCRLEETLLDEQSLRDYIANV